VRVFVRNLHGGQLAYFDFAGIKRVRGRDLLSTPNGTAS
jgi:hypothetical protein